MEGFAKNCLSSPWQAREFGTSSDRVGWTGFWPLLTRWNARAHIHKRNSHCACIWMGLSLWHQIQHHQLWLSKMQEPREVALSWKTSTSPLFLYCYLNWKVVSWSQTGSTVSEKTVILPMEGTMGQLGPGGGQQTT